MSAIENSAADKNYVEPTLHFLQTYLSGSKDGDKEKTLVAELVKQGQLLADFSESEKNSPKEAKKRLLKAGDNTKLSSDGQSLFATLPGYPKVETQQQKGKGDLQLISVVPLVKPSFDRLKATVCIYPPIPEGESVQAETLPQLLEEAGLIYGIDESAVKQAQELIAKKTSEIIELPIARGKMPASGSDAQLLFDIEIGPIAGCLLEDGSIDFRERRVIIGVEQGQLIARKIPAVPGTPGMNVFGEVIEPKKGKDIKVRTIGAVSFSEDSLEVTALKGGVLSVVNDTIIKVLTRHTVEGDVDFKTGNLDSKGCLKISGSVQPGFKVSSTGDLKIDGTVMSSVISGEANIVIQGGITGKNSNISASGDADIKFIEQGRLKAGGKIVIRTQSYFSSVTSGAEIRCHPSSIVMGGDLVAAAHVSLGTVGSENSAPALIAAGVDPERLELYEKLKQALKRQQDELIQWLQIHGNARSRKVRIMEANIDEARSKLLRLNMIPGTELYSRMGSGSSRDEINEENPLYHSGLDVDKIRIDIHGTAYAGTKLMLGNRSLVLEQKVAKRQFKLSSDMKRIIALPLRSKSH